MGAVLGIESAPSKVEMDNAALYPDEVLQALRACFDALAVGGVIEAARFKPPMLPAEGAQWSSLYKLMSQLDEPSSSDGPLHWPGFLAGVTAYCKAFKSQRTKTMARGYADGGTGLSDDALRLLLRHALVAARAGSDGGDGGGDGAALSPRVELRRRAGGRAAEPGQRHRHSLGRSVDEVGRPQPARATGVHGGVRARDARHDRPAAHRGAERGGAGRGGAGSTAPR